MKQYIFRDANEKILANYPPLQLPIKEDVIIKKSIEIFNDAEPCILHRTHIMKKIMIEIDSMIDKIHVSPSEVIRIREGIIWDYIDKPANVKYIDICYE